MPTAHVRLKPIEWFQEIRHYPQQGGEDRYLGATCTYAFFGKPGRCTRTTQKRWPVGACITTQRSGRSTTLAPSFSKRATSAEMSSVSMSSWTRLSWSTRWICTMGSSAVICSMRQLPPLPGWLGSTGRPSAVPQKRAAWSTSEVLAVDQHGAETGMVHISALTCQRCPRSNGPSSACAFLVRLERTSLYD